MKTHYDHIAEDGHTLVVLGSMEEFVELVRRARGRGYRTIVCDGYADGPARAEADASHVIDIRDTDAVARMCRDEGANGIITSFSDLLAQCYADIAQAAGLPAYLRPDQLVHLRDKARMKQMFDQLGIAYPRTARVRRESLVDDLRDLRFPCVSKPSDSWGSRGVHVLYDASEVASVFDEVSQYADEDYILVEEYNDGYEFNVTSWVVDGVPVVLAIADREKTQGRRGDIPHSMRNVYPSFYTARLQDQCQDILARVARFLGYENGPLCMQMFWSPERGIEVCECAGRIFGYEHDLLEYASAGAVSIEELLLDRVYDPDNIARRLVGHSPQLPRCAAVLYWQGYDGQLAQVSGFPQMGESCVVRSRAFYAPGDVVHHGDQPYFAYAYLDGDDRVQIDELTDHYFATAHAEAVDGSELLYPNVRMRYKEED